MRNSRLHPRIRERNDETTFVRKTKAKEVKRTSAFRNNNNNNNNNNININSARLQPLKIATSILPERRSYHQETASIECGKNE